MLLYVLLQFIVFVIVYRVDFISNCQSFIIVLVGCWATVCNLKTDSNFEFGGWRTVKECMRCTKGSEGEEIRRMRREEANATTLPSCEGTWPPRGRGGHTPPWESRLKVAKFQVCPSSFSIWFPSLFKFKSRSPHYHNSYNFCIFVLVISLSSQLWIEWSKSQNCWS